MTLPRDDLAVWRRLAPGGLLLVGAAASVVADAATRKARWQDARQDTGRAAARDRGARAPARPAPRPDLRPGPRSSALAWVAEGTLGLTLLGAGLSLFGEAVKRRALHDVAERARG